MANAKFSIPSATPATPTFSDVSASHYYFGYIEGACAQGLVNGVGGGRFAPEATISQEQAVAIIARQVAAEAGVDLSDLTEAEISAALASFPDGDSVSPGLRKEMAFAVLYSITQGNSTGELAPDASLSRLAAATLLIWAGGLGDEPPVRFGPTITSLGPTSGPTSGGTLVAIAGIGLSDATEVSFGGVSAEIQGNSATLIRAISPPHSAGTVGVAVTTPLGTTLESSVASFTYVTPLPAITALSPSTGPTAGGNTVTISGTDFSDATAVHFGGNVATSFTVSSATQITAVAPANAAGTVDVSVTTAVGTSPNTAADDYTYALWAVQGQVKGGVLVDGKVQTVSLSNTTVHLRLTTLDPLFDASNPVNNIIGTTTTDANGNYSISTASFRGAPLPLHSDVEVAAVHAGNLDIFQFGAYDRPTVVVDFQDYSAQGYGDRTLPYDDGVTMPPLPFEHLLPNYLTTP